MKTECTYFIGLKSGKSLRSDPTEILESAIPGIVAAAKDAITPGSQGILFFYVNENITYVPYASIEYVTVQVEKVEPDDGSSRFIVDDSYVSLDNH